MGRPLGARFLSGDTLSVARSKTKELRVWSPRPGAVAVFSTSSGTQPRYSSGPWFPLTRLKLDVYPSLTGATSAELLPALDLLAIGAWPSDVYFFNLSSLRRSPPPYLEAESILRSRGWVVLEMNASRGQDRVEREGRKDGKVQLPPWLHRQSFCGLGRATTCW